ncbi:MAG: MlaD family protein [Desulfobacterales bacterium]|jgi:paraquat-inducible protein B
MSKQANKTAIGAFVVVALALGVAAIVVFGSGKFFVKKDVYVAYFRGSVKGLRVGAPVVFRGVKIGEVTNIMLYSDRRDMIVQIPVIMAVDPRNFKNIGPPVENRREYLEKAIESGLRAQLQMQSLVTGQLMINVDVYPDKPARLLGDKGLADLGKDVLEIPTLDTSMQKIEKTLEEYPLEDLAKNINRSLSGIERFVNSEELAKSLHYLKQTLKDARDLIRNVDQKIDPLFAGVDQTLKDAQTLIKNVGQQVDPLTTSLTRTSDDARKLVNNVNQRVEPIQSDLKKTTKSLRNALEAAEEAITSIDGVVSENSEFRYQIDQFLRELTLAARSLRAFADYLERNPDALLRGKQRREGQR